MKILSVFGTRPEAIKMGPLVQALAAAPGVQSRVCTTGQHRAMLDQALALFSIQPDASPYGDGRASARIVDALLHRPVEAFQPAGTAPLSPASIQESTP